jgi:hypothetical protein
LQYWVFLLGITTGVKGQGVVFGIAVALVAGIAVALVAGIAVALVVER